ncbi:hypothetical protein [Clostridium manihotivorum]|nr:hypothetical protein [Clostridium manihotivorum]
MILWIIESGKDANIETFTANMTNIFTKADYIIIEGEIVYRLEGKK